MGTNNLGVWQKHEDRLEQINKRLEEIDSFGDLDPELQLEKKNLKSRRALILGVKNYIANKNGGNMGDDNKAAVANVGDELQKIEKRLNEIAQYKFVPSNIRVEKEQLLKKKQELTGAANTPPAGQAPPAEQGSAPTPPLTPPASVPDAPPAPAPTPPPATLSPVDAPSPSNQAQTPEPPVPPAASSAAVMPEDRPEPKTPPVVPDEPKAAEPAEADRQELKAIPKLEFNPWGKDKGTKSVRSEGEEDEMDTSDASLSEETGEPEISFDEDVKTSDLIKGASDLADDFDKKVSEDNPDAPYLNKVVGSFKAAIKHLESRAKKVEMSDEQKARAIKGRLAVYLSSIKAEFEFSELFDADLKNKVEDLTS